jgi:hypothetical protein
LPALLDQQACVYAVDTERVSARLEAEAAIGKLVDRSGKRVQEARTALPDAGGPDNARIYRSYVSAFVALHDRAYTKPKPSVKELDHLLWWTMNSRATTTPKQ